MNRRRFHLFSAALALLAGAVVLLLATELFPYHTTNHDEGVYLQQAAMLLEGQLAIHPPVPDSFRPWFFVSDGGRLYPKYAPVPAAMFAAGKFLGEVRLSLAAIAAGNVALTALLAAEAFDRRTGLLAGALLLASPMFLVDSSVFLPYAPTTFWNLLFAFAYFKSARQQDSKYALLAGLAVGAAFFSRPYTAVLFALPFLVHALYSLWSAPSSAQSTRLTRLARLSLTAFGGLAGVAAALAYNAVVTGSPLVFPYEAFAPHDGLGFGHRQLLGYERNYTPELALRANTEVVRELFTEWVVAGPLGTLLAAVGVGAFLRSEALRASERTSGRLPRVASNLSPADWSPEFTDAQAKAMLAALFVTVVAGNVYFWGNLNVLGSLPDPDDGLISTLGPYYHFDLLVPTSAFAASGALLAFDRVRALAVERWGGPANGRVGRSREVAAGVVLVGVLVLAGTTAGLLGPTLSEHAEITAEYEDSYQPFEERQLSDAVVFLPTPYGDWLAHPFQHLRNDPGFDGEVVYALDDGPDNLAVTAAYPNRTYYRYVYRGAWNPFDGDPVEPDLREVRVVRGERVAVDSTLAIPPRARTISARVSTEEGAGYYDVNGTPANLSLAVRVENGTARLAGPGIRSLGENSSVPVGEEDEVAVEIFVSDATGGFSYRLELPVRRSDDTITALSPKREVCLVARNCNGAAAYVPSEVPDWVRMTTDLRSTTWDADEEWSENATARRTPEHRL